MAIYCPCRGENPLGREERKCWMKPTSGLAIIKRSHIYERLLPTLLLPETVVLVHQYHQAAWDYGWHWPLISCFIILEFSFQHLLQGGCFNGILIESVYEIKTVTFFCKATLQMALWVSRFILSQWLGSVCKSNQSRFFQLPLGHTQRECAEPAVSPCRLAPKMGVRLPAGGQRGSNGKTVDKQGPDWPHLGRGEQVRGGKFYFLEGGKADLCGPKDWMAEIIGSQFGPLMLRFPSTEVSNGGTTSLGE